MMDDNIETGPTEAAASEQQQHQQHAVDEESEQTDTKAQVDSSEIKEVESAMNGSANAKAEASINGTRTSNEEDLLLQLRSWQERSQRMELLLTRKNAKIQEMEETESKLKRLLAMAKRSIDNSKQELAEKDVLIEKLRTERTSRQESGNEAMQGREPRRILQRVAQGNGFWCLIEYGPEDTDELPSGSNGTTSSATTTRECVCWQRFASDKDIRDFVARVAGEPLVIPECSMNSFETEKLKKDLNAELERVQEEFRRYRVRAEITRKQKEAELKKINANAMARQQEQIFETDLSSELHSARAQVRRLTKSQADAEEREVEWRRKYEKMVKDYEKLSGAMGETVLATEWRERYEAALHEKSDLEKKLEELKAVVNSSGQRTGSFQQDENSVNGGPSFTSASLYRGVGVGAVAAGGRNPLGTPLGGLRRMSSSSSLSGFETPHATTTNEYLKNIVYKYMITDQDEAREHMEKAIATVLNFSPNEMMAIQKRKQTSWFWG